MEGDMMAILVNRSHELTAWVGIMLWLFVACAGKDLKSNSNSVSDNPSEALTHLDSRISSGRNTHLEDLSPISFPKAEESLKDAKEALQRGKPPLEVQEMIDAGNRHIQRADEVAQLARAIMPGTILARQQAREAGATSLREAYQQAEEEFLKLTQALENKDLEYVNINKAKVLASFDRLELLAVKKQRLGAARRLIRKCREEDAQEYAPKTFANAEAKLKEADEFISSHRYEKEEIQTISSEALFQAERLVEMAQQAKKIRQMQPEEIGLWIEEILYSVSKVLSAPDMRNKAFDIQLQNILGTIEALQEDHQFVTSLGKAYSAQIESLKRDIARLEGKTREEQAAKEHSEAERRFNTLCDDVKSYFDPAEAEVYKEDNRLIIRLKAIQFPVGQFGIMPSNYGLLTKMQKSIRTFGEPDVIVEGHTDSTGSEEANEHLSQQRAEAVREYLITNGILPAEKILAVGHGSKRPLASNATGDGRAINRRIDVIITPTAAGAP
jgi:OmpA-OmpF porin, OOP family